MLALSPARVAATHAPTRASVANENAKRTPAVARVCGPRAAKYAAASAATEAAAARITVICPGRRSRGRANVMATTVAPPATRPDRTAAGAFESMIWIAPPRTTAISIEASRNAKNADAQSATCTATSPALPRRPGAMTVPVTAAATATNDAALRSQELVVGVGTWLEGDNNGGAGIAGFHVGGWDGRS